MMSHDAEAALAKARSTLHAARVLLDENLADTAASEAYYAMFHAATAALAEEQLTYSKHSAVIAAFGREFAKTNVLPRELHARLREAFAMRQRATYDYQIEIPSDEAEALVESAEEFIAAIEGYLADREE